LNRKLDRKEIEIVHALRAWRANAGMRILTKYELNRYFHFNWFDAPGTVPVTVPPGNELEFWHEIAVYLAAHRGKIPSFLQPVTDMKRVEAVLAEARRRRKSN